MTIYGPASAGPDRADSPFAYLPYIAAVTAVALLLASFAWSRRKQRTVHRRDADG